MGDKTKNDKKTNKKETFIGVALKRFRVRKKDYEKGDLYDAKEKGSYEYLINTGFIAQKK